MKCEKCNLEFSETVFPHHIGRCNIKEPIEAKEAKIEETQKEFTEEEITELRAKAKEAKIHNWHSKNPNTLLKELESAVKN